MHSGHQESICIQGFQYIFAWSRVLIISVGNPFLQHFLMYNLQMFMPSGSIRS